MTASKPSRPPITLSEMFSILSDASTMKLFEMIVASHTEAKSRVLRKEANTSRSIRLYYNRMKKLKEAHLIKKTPGHASYETTPFGLVAYGITQIAKQAEKDYWNLRAIETLDKGLPDKEYVEAIKALISDQNILQFLRLKYHV